MGQLSGTGAVFLSAGVPDPGRPDAFLLPGDSAAIAAAVSALLYVTLGRRKLIWGGHPAITAMVWAYAESAGIQYQPWTKLYQSAHFQKDFPAEVSLFGHLELTKDMGSRDESLRLMRERMFGDNKIDAAVFIGGMRGVLDEHEMLPPNVRRVPVASTGGAAEVLGSGLIGDARGEEFGLDYVALLHAVLEIDPNERRYASPDEQPTEISARLYRPGYSWTDEDCLTMVDWTHSLFAYDIFLSHAAVDAKAADTVRRALLKHGFRVYCDRWDDKELDRTHVTVQTAQTLRERMRRCNSLLYVVTAKSSTSKWMPWELGFFDGIRGKILVYPVSQVALRAARGQEYLSLFTILEPGGLEEQLALELGRVPPSDIAQSREEVVPATEKKKAAVGVHEHNLFGPANEIGTVDLRNQLVGVYSNPFDPLAIMKINQEIFAAFLRLMGARI